MNICFHFSWVDARSDGSSMFNILRNCQTVFQSGPHVTLPPAVYKGLISPRPHHYLYLCLLDYSHLDRCEVIAHCGFDLHFPKG